MVVVGQDDLILFVMLCGVVVSYPAVGALALAVPMLVPFDSSQSTPLPITQRAGQPI
jgi:hypothetical protein